MCEVDADVLADIELLFTEFPRGLALAYIERVAAAEQSPPGTEDKFYSVLVDGTKRHRDGSLMKDPATGRLLSTYRIELPGQPILGNGKSDNQNTALPFSRGPILQAIDCNQEAYLEEARCPRLHTAPHPPSGPPKGEGGGMHYSSNVQCEPNACSLAAQGGIRGVCTNASVVLPGQHAQLPRRTY